MNWNNLLANKCPKCKKELDFVSDKEMMMCDISCGFMITEKRMKEICSNKVAYRVEKRDNQAEWNNFRGVDNSEENDLQE